MTIHLADILAQENMYRRHFMNSLPGPRGVHLIATKGHRGVENVGVFSSVVHLQASPPLLGFIMRPLTVPRGTYHNILATKHYSINTLHPDWLAAAHQTSANYPLSTSEFTETGLTPVYSDTLKAPYVAESLVQIGLEYVEEHHLHGGTLFVIGKVLEVRIANEKAIAPTGHLDHAMLDTLTVAGLDTYFESKNPKRMPYARP